MSRLGKLISKGIQKDLEVDDYNYIYQHCLKPDDYLKSLKNHQKGYFKMLKVNHAHDHLKKIYFKSFQSWVMFFKTFLKR